MKIFIGKIKSLADKTESLEIRENFDEIGDGVSVRRLSEPLIFKGEARNKGKYLQISGMIRAVFLLPCDRCQEMVTYPLEVEFDEIYTAEESLANEEIILYKGNEIDILPEVTKLLFLESPMKVLCRPDCKGICPKCGKNLNFEICTCEKENIDPRLEILKKFMQ